MTIFAMDGQANGVKVSFEIPIMTCELKSMNTFESVYFETSENEIRTHIAH